MKCKLTGIDRLVILKLLPDQGDILEQTVIKEITDIVKIGSDEFDEYGIIEDPKTKLLDWDKDKIKLEKEFDLNKSQTQTLKKAVTTRDKNKEINQFNLDTCLKINKMRG